MSITSEKLGASYVGGTDIDEDCIRSTKENYEVNGLTFDDSRFYTGNLIEDTWLQETLHTADYDVVVANILADVIIPMAPQMPGCLKPNGILICSGIIVFKEQEVTAALTDAGFEILRVNHMGEWVSVTAKI